MFQAHELRYIAKRPSNVTKENGRITFSRRTNITVTRDFLKTGQPRRMIRDSWTNCPPHDIEFLQLMQDPNRYSVIARWHFSEWQWNTDAGRPLQ